MRVLLTGGSGDLGQVLALMLEERGDAAVRLDLRPPPDGRGTYVEGSILDRPGLTASMAGADAIVHIAAWHGIHEFRKDKDVYQFWDINVTGTFNVFEAAAQAGVRAFVFISSTSVEERDGLYGHTKVLGEEIARTYAARHGMSVVSLRPRAFIPHWNHSVYQSFVEWARWFWTGAVHIDDVAQAVTKSLDLTARTKLEQALVLPVDGAYEYTDADLAAWDAEGPGSTFKKHYARHYDLAVRHGLDPAMKPAKLDISATRRWLGYEPRYSLRNLLDDLERYGTQGPPRSR